MWTRHTRNKFSEKETTIRANACHEVIDVAHAPKLSILVYYSEGDCFGPDLDLMNLKRIREKIIEAMKMRTVAHHGASVDVAKLSLIHI